MKKLFKSIIVWVLWRQVDRLRAKYKPTVIAVAGSIGKTGTKRAIATVLTEGKKVQWQDGNYNDIVSVPLIFFGQKMPSLLNPVGWIKVLISNERQIHSGYPYEVVVLEVGTDYEGNMDLFTPRLKVDYGVLTAIAAEHLVNFSDMEAVATEELKITEIANKVLVNIEEVDARYMKRINSPLTYGTDAKDCHISAGKLSKDFKRPVVFTTKDPSIRASVKTRMIGQQNLPGMAAAVLLGSQLRLSQKQIQKGLELIQPFAGRMQLLLGRKQSLLIDDTYNASPEAVKAALDTLYEISAPQKIAVLGQMNELGKFSKELHIEVGTYCKAGELDLVVTIGADANAYLAEAAEKAGCKVVRCPSPYHAADIIKPLLTKGTVVLIKGSQNGVFAEETTKLLLQRPSDAKRLVRQDKKWISVKAKQFKA
ncbi:UDP-N-acetylmuramoyl-tripeptide--D-alanyl-D-alanine ligase [Candidatus Saccharibacteria bacterium]|nr:UDP-N-acetylmuramoyl-tripeptide--D-alanyl-D-alanine ligase [Candidatus Saccharibacteria bacterium]